MTETDPLAALMATTPEAVSGDPKQATARPLEQTALVVDKFGMNRATQLNQTPFEEVAEDGFTDEHPPGSLSHLGFETEEVADAFSSCFEPRPSLHERQAVACQNRHGWFDQLLETPDFRHLHAQTQTDADLSEIAAEHILRRWKEFADELPDDHDPDNPDLNDLVRGIRTTGQAVREATQDVKDAKAACAAFGLDTGGNAGTDPQAVLKTFREIRDNPTLRAIADWAGRFRRLASSLQKSKPVHGVDDVVGVVLDNDLNRLQMNELAAMCLEETEIETMARFIEKQTVCRDYRSAESVGRGPIQVLVDESSSMNSDRIAKAKGLALSLVWLAEYQDRWISLVGWSSRGQVRSVTFPPGKVDHAALMDWCGQQFGGGTHPPVEDADQLFEEAGAPEGKTDVIWITDGECSIDQDRVDSYCRFRERSQAKVWTIGISTSGESFRPISDVVASVGALSCDVEIVHDVLSI